MNSNYGSVAPRPRCVRTAEVGVSLVRESQFLPARLEIVVTSYGGFDENSINEQHGEPWMYRYLLCALMVVPPCLPAPITECMAQMCRYLRSSRLGTIPHE